MIDGFAALFQTLDVKGGVEVLRMEEGIPVLNVNRSGGFVCVSAHSPAQCRKHHGESKNDR